MRIRKNDKKKSKARKRVSTPVLSDHTSLCHSACVTWTGLTLAAPELQLGSVTMTAPNMEAAGPAFSALLSREAWRKKSERTKQCHVMTWLKHDDTMHV